MEYALQDESKWFSMDEIGFLESSEKEFQNAVLKTMEAKQLVAVIRKMEKGKVPFVDDILSRKDVYILDLDKYDTSEYWD